MVDVREISMINIQIFLLSFTLLTLGSCTKKVEEYKLDPNKNYSGKELAQIYCGGCHLYPEPSLLSEEIWKEKVLPVMGKKFGKFGPNTHITNLDVSVLENRISLSDSIGKRSKFFTKKTPQSLLIKI